MTLFPPLTFHPFALLSGTFPSSNLRIFNIFPKKFGSLLSGLQRLINSGPRRDHTWPEHFLHYTKDSPFGSTLLIFIVILQMHFSLYAALHHFSLGFGGGGSLISEGRERQDVGKSDFDGSQSETLICRFGSLELAEIMHDTRGWECIVKDDGVRSRLTEL